MNTHAPLLRNPLKTGALILATAALSAAGTEVVVTASHAQPTATVTQTQTGKLPTCPAGNLRSVGVPGCTMPTNSSGQIICPAGSANQNEVCVPTAPPVPCHFGTVPGTQTCAQEPANVGFNCGPSGQAVCPVKQTQTQTPTLQGYLNLNTLAADLLHQEQPGGGNTWAYQGGAQSVTCSGGATAVCTMEAYSVNGVLAPWTSIVTITADGSSYTGSTWIETPGYEKQLVDGNCDPTNPANLAGCP